MVVKREQAKEYLALMLSQSKAHESDNALVAFLESAEMDGPVLLQKRYAQFRTLASWERCVGAHARSSNDANTYPTCVCLQAAVSEPSAQIHGQGRSYDFHSKTAD